MLINTFWERSAVLLYNFNLLLMDTYGGSVAPSVSFSSSSLLFFLFLLQQQCPIEHILLFNASLFIKSISAAASSVIWLLPSGPPSPLFGSAASFTPLFSPSSPHHLTVPQYVNPHTLFLFAPFNTHHCQINIFFKFIFKIYSILALTAFTLTLFPFLSLLFCSRSTSSISYTLISKVSAVAVAPRRLVGAGGPSGPSTQHAPGLDEDEEEEVMACLEERWEGEEEEESKVSAGIRRRRWRPESTKWRIINPRHTGRVYREVFAVTGNKPESFSYLKT